VVKLWRFLQDFIARLIRTSSIVALLQPEAQHFRQHATTEVVTTQIRERHHKAAAPALVEQGLQLFLWMPEKRPSLRSYEYQGKRADRRAGPSEIGATTK
jgi:hypothetical protein